MKTLSVLVVLLILAVPASMTLGEVPAVNGQPLKWEDLPPLPDEFGFGGPVVGTHNDALIVAGGANFPDGPPWSVDGQPPGNKVWRDRIFVLERGSNAWRDVGALPFPLAYAAVVSTPEGIVVLGGETYGSNSNPETADAGPTNFSVATVLLLQWDADEQEVTIDADTFPELPKASHYHGAGLLEGSIYVVASHAETTASPRLDSKSLWSLDTTQLPAERRWESLSPWPGPARQKMAVAVQNTGADDHYASPKCLYLFGGSTWAKNADGELDLNQFEHFTDGYRFEPKSAVWTRIADLPTVNETRDIAIEDYEFDTEQRIWRHAAAGGDSEVIDLADLYRESPRPAAAAAAIDVGQSHILLFSGATGRFVTLDIEDRPLFPRDVLAYHTITDTWIRVGEMPEGVVTTSAVRWNDRIVIPSGEIRPGVRTPRVQAVTIEPAKSSFGAINLAVVGIYLAALVLMGAYFSRREAGTSDFFLGGGRIPWWAAGLSIYATQLSAITFISLPAVAYATNWLVYPAQMTIFLMAPVVVVFYLPFFRRLKVTTAYEYLERRFNTAVRLFGSLSFVVFQFGRMAVVVYLPALALAAVTGVNIYLCILVMGVLATVYTVMGGMEAVIWTDVLQVIVLWGGMLLALFLIVSDMGGIAPVINIAKADHKLTMFNWTWETAQMATWLIVVGNFALQFGPYTTDQAVIQRYMTTKDEKASARSIWLNGALTIPFNLLFFLLGTALYVFFKSNPEMLTTGMQNDEVFPLFVSTRMPAVFSGLVIAGIFAASMSSLDSSMHSVATAITTDFYRRFHPAASDETCLKLARVLTVIAGSFGTGVALVLANYDILSLLFFFQKLLGLISSGLVGVFILGIFTRRSNAVGALSGAAASFAVLLYVTNFTAIHFYLYAVIGITTAVIVGYVVSLLTPALQNDLGGLTWSTRNDLGISSEEAI